MTEVWKAVPGWEGIYEVSDQGRVRSLDRIVEQVGRWGNYMAYHQAGRIMRPFIDKDGYPQLLLSAAPRKRRYFIHHLVLITFVGPCPEGLVADHRNGTRADNCPENLRWVPIKDNGRNRHHVRNRTGYLGVSENPKGGPNPFWASARDRRGNKVFLGMHPTAEAANAAYLTYRETQFT